MLDDDPQERSTGVVGVGGHAVFAVWSAVRFPSRMLSALAGTCLGSMSVINLFAFGCTNS